MKKLLCALIFALCLVGCAGKEAYMTKYIVNCDSTELRRKPSDDSEVISKVKWGEEVSYVGSAKDGYVKVIHKDTTGYVLSSRVAADKPASKESAAQQKFAYLRSNQGEEAAEEQVKTVIQPMCNTINKKLTGYKKVTYGAETLWCDDLGCAKKELYEGDNQEKPSREYYFDTTNNELVYAIVHRDEADYRLYFQADKLIGYADKTGKVTYNPDEQEILEIADKAIEEAYR